MVQFLQMTKLMHDYIVAQGKWQEEKAIIEIQIPVSRTAAPRALLVSDGNPVILITIVPDIKSQPLVDQLQSPPFELAVTRLALPKRRFSISQAAEVGDHLQNPGGLARDKLFDLSQTDARRSRHYYASIAMDADTNCARTPEAL